MDTNKKPEEDVFNSCVICECFLFDLKEEQEKQLEIENEKIGAFFKAMKRNCDTYLDKLFDQNDVKLKKTVLFRTLFYT